MANYTALLCQLPLDPFVALLDDCGRKARETFFARHRIRAPKTRKTSVRSHDKNAVRAARLLEHLRSHADEPMAEELLRQLFLRQRPLLEKALDTLGVPHEEGLTQAPELSRFEQLDDAAADELVATLEQSGVDGREYARLYVPFMRRQMAEAKAEG
jgi:hypothetical protein